MGLILRGIGLLAALFSLGLTVLMLIRIRRERPLRIWSLLVSGALSLMTLPLYILLSGARLNPLLGIPFLLIGLAIGVLRGATTRLSLRGGEILGRESWFFLMAYGGATVVSQLLTLLGSALLASLGLIPLYLSAAMQTALAGTLLLRRVLIAPAASG